MCAYYNRRVRRILDYLVHVASACTCLLCRKWKGDIREHAFISSRLVLFIYALFVREISRVRIHEFKTQGYNKECAIELFALCDIFRTY